MILNLGNLPKLFGGHGINFESVIFSPNSQTLAIGLDTGAFWKVYKDSIRLFNLNTGQEFKQLSNRIYYELAPAAFSPDGKTLLRYNNGKKSYANRNNTEIPGASLLLTNIETSQVIKELQEVEFGVTTISADRKLLAILSFDSISLWNIETGERRWSKQHKWDLPEERKFRHTRTLTFSPDNKFLVVGSYNGHLIDVETGQVKDFPIGHKDFVTSAAFSSDGKTLASGSWDKTIILWDANSWKQLKTLKGHTREIKSIVFSPDGKMLASRDFSNQIKLWEIEKGKELALPRVLPEWVKFPDFAHRPNITIRAEHNENQVVFLNAVTNEELCRLILLGGNDWLVITPNGLFDGTAAAWKQLIWRFGSVLDYAPVEAFFKEFYYPGLLQEIMQGKTPRPPNKDLSQVDIRQPTVKITEIDNKATNSSNNLSADKPTVKVKVEIEDNANKGRKTTFPPSSDANDLRLFRNGSLVEIWKKQAGRNDKKAAASVFDLTEKDGCKQIAATANSPRKAVCEADVQITAGENEFTAYAFNHENVKSADATAEIKGADSLKKDGTLYVLAIGVDKYANESMNLNYAVADINAIGAEITAHQAKLPNKQYAKTEIIKLADKDATKANILAALRRFAEDGDKSECQKTCPPSCKKSNPHSPKTRS